MCITVVCGNAEKFSKQREMGGLDKMHEDLEVREAKKKSFRKSILSLLVQWREFEGQLDSTQKDFHDSFRELESREKNLHLVQESLELARKAIQQRCEEVEDRERNILLFREKTANNLESKEKELVRIRENYAKEFEEKFSEQEKRVQGLLTKLQGEKVQMEGIKNLVERRLKEIGLKDEYFENQRKEIELFRDSIEKKARELEYSEGKIKEREKKVEQKEKELNTRTEREREVELKEKEIQLMIENNEFKEKQVDFIRQLNEKRSKELGMKEKQLEMKFEHMKEKELEKKLLEKECQDLESRKNEIKNRIMDFKLKEKELEESFKELHSKENECQLEKEILEQEYKVLESRKKEFEDRMKELELREKELDLKEKEQKNICHAGLKMEPLEAAMVIRPLMMMNGKDLQIWLNEHEKDHHLMGKEVFKTLQLSKDPAKLVLEAMEGFYPPRLRKGNREFTGFVVRKSCTLLLQQLIRISPWIQSSVRHEALKIAMEWKTKITSGSSSEALGFLYLVTCYDLECEFAVEDIRKFLEVVAQYRRIPELELCRDLGLKDKFPFPERIMGSESGRFKRKRKYY